MRYAAARALVVLTHDLDFGALLAVTGAIAPSVIQVRTQNPLPSHVGSLLVQALRQFETELNSGALIVVDESRHRARLLPLRQSRQE
jgi:predicted nuclease of predicted toxin-antitoxin system